MKAKSLIIIIFCYSAINAQNLNSEADVQVVKLVQERFYFDSNSHFTVHSTVEREILQLYNLTYQIKQQEITTADSLNGFSWKGKLVFKFDAYRSIITKQYEDYSDKKWKEWEIGVPVEINFARKNGKWKFYLYEEDFLELGWKKKPKKETVSAVISRPMLNEK